MENVSAFLDLWWVLPAAVAFSTVAVGTGYPAVGVY